MKYADTNEVDTKVNGATAEQQKAWDEAEQKLFNSATMKRNYYSTAFKAKAVKYYNKHGRVKTQNKFDISQSTLDYWIVHSKKSATTVSPAKKRKTYARKAVKSSFKNLAIDEMNAEDTKQRELNIKAAIMHLNMEEENERLRKILGDILVAEKLKNIC